MKQREMVEYRSPLSWTRVIDVLTENGNQGMTNKEIANVLDTDYARVRGLTLVMWEHGALSRVHVGETGGATFYFLPITEEVSDEERSTAL
ncbi:hypothetical protein DPV79_15945 [Burkholderia reimsis]|uniref:MarR family transcriptional regulator n=1 Tax=Burkholderia reimsis TaxID=2234132 RepID=A0A365QUS8_9BURK|nr:hypothetical protein [Burkholderia reimsis]RBB38871.1 hypothetical protein DPV79_15945 [Burkholderia reimsis]